MVLEVHAAGVDQRNWRPFQSVGELLAVARDARRLVHDGLAGLREPVDERGLADVRVADDGDLPRRAALELLGLDRQRDDLVDDLVER